MTHLLYHKPPPFYSTYYLTTTSAGFCASFRRNFYCNIARCRLFQLLTKTSVLNSKTPARFIFTMFNFQGCAVCCHSYVNKNCTIHAHHLISPKTLNKRHQCGEKKTIFFETILVRICKFISSAPGAEKQKPKEQEPCVSIRKPEVHSFFSCNSKCSAIISFIPLNNSALLCLTSTY